METTRDNSGDETEPSESLISFFLRDEGLDESRAKSVFDAVLWRGDEQTETDFWAHADGLDTAIKENLDHASMEYFIALILEHADKFKGRSLAKAGSNGGRARHRKTDELKVWVDQQKVASTMNTTDQARKLVRMMPKEFWETHKNPERVIRDHLLHKLNTKSRLRQAG